MSEIGLTGIYNDRRHHLQLPMWVSGDAARVVRWIRRNASYERGSKYSPLRTGEVSYIEVASVVLEGQANPRPGTERRERVKAVIRELMEANLLGEAGYHAYRLRPEIADAVIACEPPLEVAGR